MKPTETKRKRYVPPQLIEYGDLGRLIRANPAGAGMPDAMGTKGMPFKTG